MSNNNPQQFYGLNQLFHIQQLMQDPECISVLNAAKDLYGRQRQLLHAVEELNELSCSLLQALKRGFDGPQIDSMGEEVADVIIQTVILLDNFPLYDIVMLTLPEKIQKAKINIKKQMEKQREGNHNG